MKKYELYVDRVFQGFYTKAEIKKHYGWDEEKFKFYNVVSADNARVYRVVEAYESYYLDKSILPMKESTRKQFTKEWDETRFRILKALTKCNN